MTDLGNGIGIASLTKRAAVMALTLLGASLCISGVQAEDYPSKPIHMIVPFTPGGLSDVVARLVGNRLTQILGQSVIIDQKPGASGMIGTNAGAKAPPDGYTIVLVSNNLTLNPYFLASKMEYSNSELAPISLLLRTPQVLIVNKDLPVQNLQQLKEMVKAKPGQVSYASAGTGTQSALGGLWLAEVLGGEMTGVPYKGGSQSVTDVAGGRVSMMFDPAFTAIGNVATGRTRALAIAGEHRVKAMPDVPTFREEGYKDFTLQAYVALLAPAKTPAPIMTKLSQAVAQVMAMPDVRDQLERSGIEVIASTPEQFASFIKEDTERWAKFGKDHAIEPQ
jgi:tripartite-type tricarboxylate transporter receptor subunit TctC